jgi:ribulose-bisphosphate carboxylase large chain
MKPVATVARVIGVDQLHVGTVVGKMSETKAEVIENIDACKTQMGDLKPVLPVASGGLHPRLIPSLMETFGNNFVIQAGGGIHGHPDGTVAGAKAMRQAVDATLERKTLEEYAKNHKELATALKQWKT